MSSAEENNPWVYHSPRRDGEGFPDGMVLPGVQVNDALELQFKPMAAVTWTGACQVSFLVGMEYRYRSRATAASPAPSLRDVCLPEDQDERNKMCLFDGFMAYFPNAMAEVSKLSFAATQQHHPDQPMHWDRSKSTDHLNKIGRHMIDAGKLDDKGQRHSAALAWRAMANLQEELERDLGLPPSPASRNRPF